ncbi:inovirus-type Gp2 protein [Vibrio splendidus]
MYEPPYEGKLFNGLPINYKNPMSERYLKGAHAVYRNALTRYPKIFMFHVILRFPENYSASSKGVMTAFTRALKLRVKRDLMMKRCKRTSRVHGTGVHYVWCREFSEKHREHYHVFIMVNANTYRALGDFDEPIRYQLAGMVSESWATALSMSLSKSKGLAHFVTDVMLISTRQIPEKVRTSKDGTCHNLYEAGFFWLSYLCKLTTKEYGRGGRNFGCSTVT